MMKRIGSIAVWLAAVASANFAHAQDSREIEPYFMIVVDTSLSMEQRTECECDPHSCANCMPKCDVPNVNGEAPASKKNRWAVALEALTGTFNDFQCEPVQRNSSNLDPSAFDLDPSADPYHQPWDCRNVGAGKLCPYSTEPTADAIISQNADGILDRYESRVSFGMMTFDGEKTYVGSPDLIESSQFDEARANGSLGMWSYGDSKPIGYPGCDHLYRMNSGVRNASATEGGLVTMNSCPEAVLPARPCPSTCSACPGTLKSLNADIQAALLRTRPYGSTPIAGALSDLEHHLLKDLTDPFQECRPRYALLLTDGRPDNDYHLQGCNCGSSDDGDPPCPGGVTPPPDKHQCPYEHAWKIANRLVHGTTDQKPLLERLFVVGMSVTDGDVRAELNKIAEHGCKTTGGCDTDNDNNVALFADNFDTLMQNLVAAVDHALAPVSRSIPAFATANEVTTNVDPSYRPARQYQLTAAFEGNTEPGAPWAGKIERRRFTCRADEVVAEDLDVTKGDLFHETLNQETSRNLVTVLPSSGRRNEHLTSNASGSDCGTNPCSFTSLAQVSDPRVFGSSVTATEMTAIKRWMQGGRAVSERPNALGDIYHSSPAIVAAPRFSTADEAYNEFRAQAVVAKRPTIMYVNSNDGVLHAFSIENWNGTQIGRPNLSTGQEVWGFIPPALLDKLQGNLNGHKMLLDASPVVKDVYFKRVADAAPTAQDYHTVLITGTRSSEKSFYVALDITDPQNAKFLWQFTHDELGITYGQAAIGQASYRLDNATKHGAIALLPGGAGEESSSATDGCTLNRTLAQLKNNGQPFFSYPQLDVQGTHEFRGDVRCWKRKGRSLFVVDIETGKLIRQIRNDTDNMTLPPKFPSPFISTPVVYSADVGTQASRAFVVDADGVVWRFDLSSSDPLKWDGVPFHDLFWDRGPFDGEVSYEAPLLSINEAGELVVIVGTGDTNNFTKTTAQNRVVSLTEIIPPATHTVTNASYRARLNWQLGTGTQDTVMQLGTSELVTGSMALFEGQLFFATFKPVPEATRACDLGLGRIFAVDYLKPGTIVNEYKNAAGSPVTRTTSYGPLKLDDTISAAGINVSADNAIDDMMIMGMSVTQRPTCSGALVTDDTDVYDGVYRTVKQLNPPAVYLVAAASGGASAVTKRSLSQVGSVELKLKKKQTYSKVTSWATSVD